MNNFTTQQVISLQRGVRGVLGFGVATSIAANIVHVLTRPDVGAMEPWRLWVASALASLAPVVLFASTEMVTRIPVHSKVLGVLRLIITLALAGAAAWISYWAIVAVAAQLGEHGTSQYLYPFIIDGMMVVATISLIELGRLARNVGQVERITAEAAQAEAQAAQVVQVTQTAEERAAERAAQAASGYARKSPAAKAKWTTAYRARVAKEKTQAQAAQLLAAVSPVSPDAWSATPAVADEVARRDDAVMDTESS